MVDNRAAGFYGISGAINFKSGDISGTAAKTNEEKYGSDAEYQRLEKGEKNANASNKFSDRSAQLNAALSSLAMLNISSVISSKLPKKLTQTTKRFKELIDETEEMIVSLNEEHDKEQEERRRSKEQTNPFAKQEDFEEDDDEYF